ncbi:MAG: class I SAM-dependent methyltransferase [Acidobacteriota bacterium]
MREYDEVGLAYLDCRSPDIGVPEILGFADAFRRPISVLDLGCGTGFPIAEALWPRASHYVGVDSSSVLLAEFSRRLPGAEAILAGLEDVDLGGRTFDFVFAFGSLFHLRPGPQRAAFAEACRSVAPGGLLAVTSGADAGACTGTVAGVVVPHWSIGEVAYVEIAGASGLRYDGTQLGGGGHLFFRFRRPSADAGASPGR